MKLQKVRQNSYKGEVNNLVRNFERLWRMTDKCYEKLALYDDTVEKLNTTASELSDKLDSIEDSVSECVSSVTSMNKTLSSYASRITALENQFFGISTSYDGLTNRIDDLESYTTGIHKAVNENADRISELSESDLALLERITPFENANIINRVTNLESAVSALQNSSGDSYDDSELVDRIDALETQVGTNTTSISTLSTNVDTYYNTNARNITTLSNTVSTLSDSLDTTNSNVDSIQSSINALGSLYAGQVQITSVENTGKAIIEGGSYGLAQFVIPDGLIVVGILGFTLDDSTNENLRIKNYFVHNVQYPYQIGCYIENSGDDSVTFSAYCLMATLTV